MDVACAKHLEDGYQMKYVVIRDDDISYFTKPETLAKVYGRLFEENKPVNFAVVPKITSDIKTPSYSLYWTREKNEYDPIIPPRFRGCNEDFPLGENREIVEFIRSLENCEVLQHGLTHGLIDGVQEFRINDEKEIKRRANLGSDLLEECFHSKPSFFVAPWNNISSETIHFLKSHYKGLSVGSLDPRLAIKFCDAYIKKTLLARNYLFYGTLLIIERSGYQLSRFYSPDSILSKVRKKIETNKIVVLVNHHWEYFFDWSQLDQPFFDAWQGVTEYLLQKEDLHFLTFSELYNRLRGRI
jgi:hypothetical protein